MSKQTQIEEMQADLMLAIVWSDGGGVKCGDTAKNLYDADYRKRREVAAEIFAEIEKHECSNLFGKTNLYMLTAEEFDELKKKYTEDQTND